jgi:hypothetical protein
MRKIWNQAALLGALFVATAANASAQNGGSESAPSGPQEMVLDRWLISHSYGKDAGDTASIADYLGIFEDVDFFPDRGRRVGTTIWTLYRDDGAHEVDLDEMFGERLENGITFAHIYVWVPGWDRTLRIETSGSCHYPRVVLNGHALPHTQVSGETGAAASEATSRACPPGGLTETVLARFAAGWNQLLIGVDAGEGPYTFGARLLPGSEDGLRDIRIQASRPPGVRRGVPEPWITMPRFVLAPELVWFEDQLGGVIEYDLVGWGRPPGGDIRIEIEFGKFKLKGDADGVRAMRPTTFRAFVPLEALRDAGIGKGPVQVTMKWEKVTRRIEPGFAASEIVAAAGNPARAMMWLVPGALGGDLSAQAAIDAAVPPLPTAAGEIRAGGWKVPDELDGATLRLDVAGSPSSFLVNGMPRPVAEDGRLTLCEDCKKGSDVLIQATSTDAWQAYPTIHIGWDGSRAGSPTSAGSAAAWLSKLP